MHVFFRLLLVPHLVDISVDVRCLRSVTFVPETEKAKKKESSVPKSVDHQSPEHKRLCLTLPHRPFAFFCPVDKEMKMGQKGEQLKKKTLVISEI